MGRPLNILLVEDNLNDAELLLRQLRRAGFDPVWSRVDTEADYMAQLNPSLDVIFSDYEMPQFNGLRALELLEASPHDIPFVIVSGTIGEDTAVAAMKCGACDYLLKDRLGRLEQAVTHALEQRQFREERQLALLRLQESEERLRDIFDGISAYVSLFSTDGRFLELNRATLTLTAQPRGALVGSRLVDAPWWTNSGGQLERISAALVAVAHGRSVREELQATVPGGLRVVMEATFSPLFDAAGRCTQGVVSGTDISTRKQGEQKIREQLDELLRWQEVILNREDRVHALKAEVNELLVRASQPMRYPSASPV